MAVTENSYTGNGSTTNYSFTFPYIKTTDIEVQVDATVQATSTWSLANATTVQFNTAPSNGAAIKILRNTNIENLSATFYAGSAIKSEDLNDNFNQSLYVTQETGNRSFENTGTSTMIGNLNMGEDTSIVFEGATDNAHETKLTVADPTADRVLTLPNVSGNIVTTGDTATVTGTMLASNSVSSTHIAASQVGAAQLSSNAVTTAKIADGQVTTAKIAADAVTEPKIADNAVTDAQIAADAVRTANILNSQVTAAKIAADAIDSTKISDGAVTVDHIGSGQVTEVKIASNAITQSKIAAGAVQTGSIANDAVTGDKIADDQINSEHYIDGSIDTAHIASNAINETKIADDAVTDAQIAADAVRTANILDSQVTTAKIAANAITEPKIADDAVTNAQIADDAVRTAHILDSQVTTAKIAPNAITEPKIADDAITDAQIAADAVRTANILDSQVTTAKVADDAITAAKIGDAELTTLAGMQSGTASVLAGGTALAATLTEINTICDGKSVQTTISDTDTSYPTSGAVIDYVTSAIAPLGGLEVIANEDSFPAIPASGVVISIADAGGIVVNGSGVSTTARTSGNGSDNVTINGFPSSLHSTTLANSMGLMVSSTGSNNTYTYHKLLGKEDDIKQLSDDINDFGNRYRVASSAPSSSLDEGDLWWDSSTDKLKVYDGSAWGAVASSGDFYINTISSYSGTGGNSATFNGSAYRFVLSNPGSTAQQHFVSVNGVVQKPNSGTSQPAEGFAIDGSSIIFSSAPASGADYFITTIGDAVSIGTPSDNTVATAKIQNLAVTTGKIANDAVTGAKIADDAVGAEHIEVLDAALQFGDSVQAQFGDDDDLRIFHDNSHGYISNRKNNLYVSAPNYVQITTTDTSGSNTETSAKFLRNGNCELYYDNSKTFETVSGGAKVTGKLEVNGDVQWDGSDDSWGIYWDKSANNASVKDNAYIGFGTSNDLQIYHDGTDSRIDNVTGSLILRVASTEKAIACVPNDAVELYYDNVKKFETKSWGAYVYGDLNVNGGDLLMNNGDSHKIKLGAGNDLELFHDGTNSYIDNETGSLYIETGASIYLTKRTGGAENMAAFNVDGGAFLYYNNSVKIETTSGGVTVQGSVTESSDMALKTNIEPLDNVLDKIQQITGYKYQFKDTGHDSMGVTAQDVEKVFPELVHGEEGSKTLQYSGLIGALIESVKELSNKVAALEAA